jgi:hypothetical protein
VQRLQVCEDPRVAGVVLLLLRGHGDHVAGHDEVPREVQHLGENNTDIQV